MSVSQFQPPFSLAALTEIDLLLAALTFVAGTLVGSFANVVIYRLPRSESVVFPGSHCPHCNRKLGPLELVPILSWLLQRGRCRGCGARIWARYPLVELLTGILFLLVYLRWPAGTFGATLLPVLAVVTLLVILAFIDADTFTLPDVLVFPALAVALLGSLVYAPGSGLPDPGEALWGAGLGAGGIVMLNRVGGLLLRRFRDTRERLWPLGFDLVNIVALVGLLLGLEIALVTGLLVLIRNLAVRRSLRLPEPIILSLWLIGALYAGVTAAAGAGGGGGLLLFEAPLLALRDSLAAAGVAAVAGGLYWWLHDALQARKGQPEPDADEEETQEPVAMGFGDVKLAAVIGALLGPMGLLVALLLSFLLGAFVGVLLRLLGGVRVLPFGPYLVAGALIVLFTGDALPNWYLNAIGV